MQRCLWPSALQKRNGLFGPMDAAALFLRILYFVPAGPAHLGIPQILAAVEKPESGSKKKSIDDHLKIRVFIETQRPRGDSKICPLC